MPQKPNKIKAKSSARSLLKELGNFTIPINLVSLLDFLDIGCHSFDSNILQIKNSDSKEISAFINYTDNIILYNSTHPKNRIRFSIAHEIGHYQLKHKSLPHPTTYNTKDPVELEANLFAAELLMPLSILRSEKIDNEESIKQLADKYHVSLEAMQWRIWTDNLLLGSSYDYNINNMDVHAKQDDNLLDSDYDGLYPPPYDNNDEILEFYSNIQIDDLKALAEKIVEEEDEEKYSYAFKVIKLLMDETEASE